MSHGFGTMVLMSWCCVVALSAARASASWRSRLPMLSTAVGLGLATYLGLGFGATPLDGGELVFDGSWQVDHFAMWVDVLAAALAGLLSQRPARSGRISLASLMAVWLGAAAASVAAHATHVITLLVAMEVAALVGIARSGAKGPDASRRIGLLFTVSAMLGAALVFGATADLQLAGMSGRVAKVFNQWGGSQRWLSILLEKGDVLPEGYQAQMRGRIISGMAPASLLLPGVLFMAVAAVGRFLAGGSLADPERAFARLAALVVLVRVFVAALHAPRMVNEPYGWVGPLGGVALAWMLLGAWRSTRARALDGLNRGISEVNLGLMLLSLVLAANYYGHRAMADGPVSVTLELSWSQRAGDDALSAGLAVCTVAFLGSALLWVLTPRCEDGEHVRLRGLVGRDRMGGWTVVLSAWASSGLPFACGFVPLLAVLRSLVEHSSLRPYLPLVVSSSALASLAAMALATRVLWGAAAPEVQAPRLRAGLVFPFVLAGSLLGFAPEHLMGPTRLAASGVSLPLGRSREAWVANARLRWEGRALLEGLEARERDEASASD